MPQQHHYSPQRKVEELEEAVGEAEVAEAEAGGVARESHPALVVDVSSHLPRRGETGFTFASGGACLDSGESFIVAIIYFVVLLTWALVSK